MIGKISIAPIDVVELYNVLGKIKNDIKNLTRSMSNKYLKEDINNLIGCLNRTSFICAKIIGQSEAYESMHRKLVVTPADKKIIQDSLSDIVEGVEILLQKDSMIRFMGSNSAIALAVRVKQGYIDLMRSSDDDEQINADFILIIKKMFEISNQCSIELNKALLNA
jgi:hypothetical protein